MIVDWFSENDGHYSVVTRATRSEVTLMDPERGYRTLPRSVFERVWFDFDDQPPEGRLRRRTLIEIAATSKVYDRAVAAMGGT